MGILIVVVIIVLVAAAIGAGIYVIIFRAKHKKEVMANSQTIGGGVPVYGQPQDQQAQGQPDFANNMADIGQTNPAPSPMMNDIMGSVPTNDTLSGMSQTPQPPAQESFVEAPQEVQPSISRDFAPETTQPEFTPAPAAETPALDNTLDLNQPSPQNNGGENILDDTQTVAPISEMAKDDMGQTPDGDMADFSVPVTENESLEKVDSGLGEAAVSAQTEERVEQSATQEPPGVSPEPQPETPIASEPPVAPEPTVTTPQPPTENAVPTLDNVVGGQDADTKEMHI